MLRCIVTHNPITRQIAELIKKRHEVDRWIHIETRATRHDMAGEGRMFLPCETVYTNNALINALILLDRLFIEKVVVYLPHLNNDLFQLIADHPMAEELYYIEEGNLSSGKALGVTLDPNQVRPGCKQQGLLRSDINPRVVELMMNTGYRQEGINEIWRVKGNGYPPFYSHEKYKGVYSMVESAFPGFDGLKHQFTSQELPRVRELESACVVYLPSSFAKLPKWIYQADRTTLQCSVDRLIYLLESVHNGEIVLKSHPSTPEWLTNQVSERVMSQGKLCVEWERAQREILRRTGHMVHEAPLLRFECAIFTCFSSAVTYTRACSPTTRILFPYSFS